MTQECENLALYFYGEMTAEEEKEFASHLRSCPACQRELAFLGHTREALFPPAAPARVTESVCQYFSRPVFSWRRLFKPAAAVAAVMGICVYAFLSGPVLQPSVEQRRDWTAYVSYEMDNEYDTFVADFEAFENEF